MGFSVASAGDVNGDGLSEVIVGAPFFSDDPGISSEGKVWVFRGSRSGVTNTGSWSRESGEDTTYYGYSVASAGDVNGDGYADVIIGAPYDSAGVGDGGDSPCLPGLKLWIGDRNICLARPRRAGPRLVWALCRYRRRRQRRRLRGHPGRGAEIHGCQDRRRPPPALLRRRRARRFHAPPARLISMMLRWRTWALPKTIRPTPPS